jgi:hypothetical protein
MKCCLHRPHLGLDGGLGDVAHVSADGSRTVCTIASPAKTDTEWCQLKILVPPLPSKLKFSNPAKKSINALAHLWDVEPQRGGKASVERWSAAAGRQCVAGVASGRGRAPELRAGVAPGRGRAPGRGSRPVWCQGEASWRGVATGTAKRQLGEGGGGHARRHGGAVSRGGGGGPAPRRSGAVGRQLGEVVEAPRGGTAGHRLGVVAEAPRGGTAGRRLGEVGGGGERALARRCARRLGEVGEVARAAEGARSGTAAGRGGGGGSTAGWVGRLRRLGLVARVWRLCVCVCGVGGDKANG